MKTRYKIPIIIIVIVFVILFGPPNIAAFSCNTLEIKDLQCHIMGMSFFGLHINTNIYEWFGWDDDIPCGGVLAHPDKAYHCIGIEDYWGIPSFFSRTAEQEHYKGDKIKDPSLVLKDLHNEDTVNSLGCPQFCPKEPKVDERIKNVLDSCESKKLKADNFMTKDGIHMAIAGTVLHFFNDTHYIDDTICEWQKIEKYPNTDFDCIPGNNKWLNSNVIRNDTHIYNAHKCLWEVEVNWEND